jgi:hypothetical protein
LELKKFLTSRTAQAALVDSIFFVTIVSIICTTLFSFAIGFGTKADSAISSFYSTDFATDCLKVISYINVLRDGTSISELGPGQIAEYDYLLALIKEDFRANAKCMNGTLSPLMRKPIVSTVSSVLAPFDDSIDYAFYIFSESGVEKKYVFLLLALHKPIYPTGTSLSTAEISSTFVSPSNAGTKTSSTASSSSATTFTTTSSSTSSVSAFSPTTFPVVPESYKRIYLFCNPAPTKSNFLEKDILTKVGPVDSSESLISLPVGGDYLTSIGGGSLSNQNKFDISLRYVMGMNMWTSIKINGIDRLLFQQELKDYLAAGGSKDGIDFDPDLYNCNEYDSTEILTPTELQKTISEMPDC